ncbi:GNAT family N-acetyltransferase [Streptomyces sp. NPDC051597]|uniref:GNAT family N-acetyltransferase n=1 Tax=Streptomyces sp. NPDC051597 TaxID=3155049 RepID=UPI00344A8DB4
MNSGTLDLQQVTTPDAVTPELRHALIDCWIEVTNAGGAAGFPFPPIGADQAGPAVDALVADLDPRTSRFLVASVDGHLVGWLNVRRALHPLTAHWGTVHHVQTRTTVRGRGIGVALMNRLREIAREEMGLEALHLAARGGVGLEDFYGRLGWKEIGRWPDALRLAPGDDRDEVLMLLAPL